MSVPREVVPGFEPKAIDRLFDAQALGTPGPSDSETDRAGAAAAGATASPELLQSVPGVRHSRLGLAHDRMHGGVKGRRMSKKDKLRAAAAAAARRSDSQPADQGSQEQSTDMPLPD